MINLENTRRTRAIEGFKSQILRGFVVEEIWVLGLRFKVKLLSEVDERILTPFKDEEAGRVALSLYEVEGIQVYDPQTMKSSAAAVRELLGRLPELVTISVIYAANRMLRQYRQYAEWFTEFIESTESRSLWGDFVAAGKDRYLFVGEPLNSLPYSEEYIAWSRYNIEEDLRQEREITWSFVRLLVATQSSQAAKSLPEKLYQESSFKTVQNRLTDSVRSNEDLVAQLEALIAGKEDEHDRVVAEMEDAWVLEYEKAAAEEEAIRLERQKESPDDMITSSWSIIKEADDI